MRRRPLVRNLVHVRRRAGAAGDRCCAPSSHELRDQHGVGLVVTHVTIVRRLGIVIECHEPALGVEPAAQLECERRPFRVPRRFFVPHPLHAHRPADFPGEVRRLESRVVRRRTAVALRPFHPDDADLFARHAEELCDPVSHAVGLHVVRVDRHLTIRRVRKCMRWRECGMPLKRHVVFGFNHGGGTRKRRVGIALHRRSLLRSWRCTAHVRVEIVRRREWRRGRFLPLNLELPGRGDRLLFPLAHDGDVVALADDLDEAGKIPDRGLVDADQRRAGHWRFDVARVHHARKLDVDGPFQRAVHLRGDVVALRRLADAPEILHRLDLGRAGGCVDIVAGQRDVESFSSDQLAVGDLFRGIRLDGDEGVADGELRHRNCQPGRGHFEQHAARLGGHAPHRPAVGLDCVRPARSALIHRDVGAAHHAAGLVECDVELVGHHLAEGGAGTLTAVGLADVERRGVVFVNDDPRVELAEVGVGIGSRASGALARQANRLRARICRKRAGGRRGADPNDQHPRTLEEVPSRNVRRRFHATPAFAAPLLRGRPAIVAAARLMAACTR